MPALTPQFLFDFETNLQTITESEYTRLAQNLWWSSIMKTRPSGSRKEIIAWLLSTAKIEDQGKGGNIAFEDIVSRYTTYETRAAGAGLKLNRLQLEDLDGNGLDIATQWSSDIGAYMAYWPQKQLVKLIKNGEEGHSYDDVPFFSNAHPQNPYNPNAGVYSNLIVGKRIDASVSVDVALQNLGDVVATIQSIKMPNGEDPRFLVPRTLLVPPKMVPRAQQLTNAKFIAQAAASGGGSGDIEAIISNWGFTRPIEVAELAGFENDTTYYVGVEQMTANQLGAFVYIDREPFAITYYTGRGGGTGVDAFLDRAHELEWHCFGRNVAGYGHPFLFFKCKAA